MSQRLTFAPGGPSFWADLIEFAIVDTASGQVLLQQANKDESEAVPFTGAPSPVQPIADLANAGLVQLVGNPIAFINPKMVAEYVTQGTTAVTVTYLSGRQQAFTFAAMVNFLAWTPPTVAGVFEPGTGTGSVQQAGVGANAAGLESFAFGVNAEALLDHAIAIGKGTLVEFHGIAIGVGATVVDPYGMAIGSASVASGGTGNIAVGQGATTSAAQYATALGWLASAQFDYAIAVGYEAIAYGSDAVVMGKGASGGSASVVIGSQALGSALFSNTVVGFGAQANTNWGVAIGTDASANFEGGIAMGYAASVADDYGVAIGSEAVAVLNAVAIGESAVALSPSAVAIGGKAAVGGGDGAIALLLSLIHI